MANRDRPVQIKFRVSKEERQRIEQNMAKLGTRNMAAYIRKMALAGYIVKLDLPELKTMVSLLRYSSNNMNQIAQRVHETQRIYDADIEDIKSHQEKLWQAARDILTTLAKLG